MATHSLPPLRIGIIGAGFSGTALAAALHRLAHQPLHITLIDKTGSFGLGAAYRTPFLYHLLNVRACEMSAFEDEPAHFVNWLHAQTKESGRDDAAHFAEQFAPRVLYGRYLQELLQAIKNDTSKATTLTLIAAEAVDVLPVAEQAKIILHNGEHLVVDKVIFALGNNLPCALPFNVTATTHTINNPWEYQAPERIPKQDPVLIVGSGLSMIDTVLTLHYQKHAGFIYVVSRHGLLPLPHSENKTVFNFDQPVASSLRALTKQLRDYALQAARNGEDWRAIVQALRVHLPALWQQMSLFERKQFIRHVLPYWNIHRHCVQADIVDLLEKLRATGQLHIIAGRVASVTDDKASIILRGKKKRRELSVKWVINCLGPQLTMPAPGQTLVQALLQRKIAALGDLHLGFAVDSYGALQDAAGVVSSQFFTLGPPQKNKSWETSAVPEIRKQCFAMAKHLLK